MIPRIVVAAANSGSGKTMITCGIARALKNRGYTVQTFKVGPDFIDPKYHSLASGRYCANLDSWLMDEGTILKDFSYYCSDADIAIIEGVRSLYDSSDPLSTKGSTYSVAKILKAPIILTIDVRGLNMGAAAIVKGFKTLFDADIRGVILNSSRGEKHELKVKKAIEELTGIEVLGAIPRKKELEIEMRHLGLVTVEELEKSAEEKIKIWAEVVEERIDLDKIVKIAESAEKISTTSREREEIPGEIEIAIAYDKAFNFYYAQNLDLLRNLGAKIHIFSPLQKFEDFEQISGVIIGGGYPELYACEFNERTMELLREKIEDECPVYAECGGLMYLCKNLINKNEKFRGVGVIDADAIFDTSRRYLGYVRGSCIRENILFGVKDKIQGHEFHYSYLEIQEDVKYAYRLERGYGIDGEHDGILVHSTLASYIHLLFSGQEKSLKKFLENAAKYSKR